MHRKREHVGVAVEYGGGAIALVHVEIDDQRPANPPLALQDANGDRHVVEHAEPLAVTRKRVMGTAREVAGQAVIECRTRSLQRAARSKTRPPPQRGGPGHAELADGSRIERPGGKSLQVLVRVDEAQFLEVGFGGLDQRPIMDQAIPAETLKSNGYFAIGNGCDGGNGTK